LTKFFSQEIIGNFLFKAKYLTRKMTASSVEAMHSIDALFDKIAVGFYFY